MEKKYEVVPVSLYKVTVNGTVTYYSQFVEMSDGYAKVMKNGKWGILTPCGNILGKIEYSEIYDFCDDIARVVKNGKYGYVDRKREKVITDCIYDKATNFKYGLADVIINKKKRRINILGKYID